MLNWFTRISVPLRLALTSAAALAGTLLLADRIGIVPQCNTQLIRGRLAVCQSLAINGSRWISDGDPDAFVATVATMVQRNESLESARLIDAAGRIRFQTAGHQNFWSDHPDLSQSNLTVPIVQGGKPWGRLQVAFKTPGQGLSPARYGVWGLLAFTLPVCFLQFLLIAKSIVCVTDDCGSASGDDCLPSESPRTSDRHPIHTTLTVDDDEIRDVVADFITRLNVRLDEMQRAVENADFQTLRSAAHWLKGSGGTVGFSVLSAPARELENAAEDEDLQVALQILAQLQDLRARLVSPQAIPASTRKPEPTRSPPRRSPTEHGPSTSPSPAKADAPIECTLPLDDEEYLSIVVDFVKRLDIRLMGMLSMLQTKAFEELENEAHWLKGAGGTVGFSPLTEPSRVLMVAARQQNVYRCQEALKAILNIRQRMRIPNAVDASANGH